MALTIGVVLALAVGVMCTVVGMDRDRALYCAVTMVVASLYVLFAVMGASTETIALEMLAASVFIVCAVVGFKSSLWIVAFALTMHGVFDFVHGRIIANPGVPVWWPAFCGAYDVTAGAYFGWLLKSGRTRVS